MSAQPHTDWSGRIFDELVAHPDGCTIYEMAEAIDMPLATARRAVHDARMILAQNDTLFILAEPQGPRAPWLYKLVDGKTIIDVENSGWVPNRIGDAQTRVQLIHAAMRVAERATDGRTTNGRKARVIARTLGRLVEDLEEIDLGSEH
jgi:hypothetical protein